MISITTETLTMDPVVARDKTYTILLAVIRLQHNKIEEHPSREVMLEEQTQVALNLMLG